jgi:hypothetical protein
MLRIINKDRDVFNLLLMSGEAHFHVTVFVNKQNMRCWTEVNRREVYEQPLRSHRVAVGYNVEEELLGLLDHFPLKMIIVKALQLLLSAM